MSASPGPSASLPLNEQFFLIISDGEEPQTLWARTCSDPDCDCRTALVVTHEDGEYLRGQVKQRSESWMRGKDPEEAFGDLTAFELDLDWFEAFGPLQVGVPEVSTSSKVRRIMARMSESLQDEIAALWFRQSEGHDAALEKRFRSRLVHHRSQSTDVSLGV